MAFDDKDPYVNRFPRFGQTWLQFGYNREKFRWNRLILLEKPGIEEPAGIDIPHRGKHRFLEIGILLFEVGEHVAQGPADGAGSLRAAARDHGNAARSGVGGSDVLGDEYQRPDQP